MGIVLSCGCIATRMFILASSVVRRRRQAEEEQQGGENLGERENLLLENLEVVRYPHNLKDTKNRFGYQKV
jgi:hypothetical protein